jgi:hypothetical protein
VVSLFMVASSNRELYAITSSWKCLKDQRIRSEFILNILWRILIEVYLYFSTI